MTTRRLVIALMLAAGAVAPVFAQSESALREGELTIDVDVRFISTYRNGTWVPVDIIVNNNDRDIDGYLEVVAKQAGMEQAPRYQVPVDSPKGSRKRFRLYCMFDGTTDMEAMLYRGRRPALSVPMKIRLNPIDKDDYLCLVLDDKPADYLYLNSAVLKESSDLGFYRIELHSDELSALPDRLRCYEPIDLIVMGDIDPDDISRRHRALIQRYVENGGTLVICTGENAPKYRGSWVEELAGVSLGGQQIVNEAQFAAMALEQPTTDRLNAAKQGEYTLIEPSADGVYRWGGEVPLASLRPVERGFVAVVALDMPAKLLHTTSEYAALWTRLANLRADRPDVNIGRTSSYLRGQLPNVVGVRVFPRSSVATYLTIYLLVAIIGNWVFWSFLKRREMAWVCLVLFSAGFTAYAMIYGTAGRAKETELEQINIVRVYSHTPVAKVHSTVGLLSARSARYSFDLADEGGLVSQGEFNYYGMPYGEDRFDGGSFAFVQGSQPRVADLRVGASVMRSVQVESELMIAGGIEGTLTHDETGLHGTLINKTGLQIAEPWIYYQGRQIRAKVKPGTNEIEVKRTAAQLNSIQAEDDASNYPYYGYYYGEVQSVQTAILEPIKQLIFVSPDGVQPRDPSLGPYVYGWAVDSPPPSIRLAEEAKMKIRETFVVADVDITGDAARPTPYSLAMEVNGQPKNLAINRNYYRDFNSLSDMLRWDRHDQGTQNRAKISIDLPRDVATRAAGDLIIDLKWVSDRGQPIVFLPEDAPDGWAREHAETKGPQDTQSLGTPVEAIRYRVPDWQPYYDENDGVIRGSVVLMPEEDLRRRGSSTWAQFIMQAYLEVSPKRAITEEWKPWR